MQNFFLLCHDLATKSTIFAAQIKKGVTMKTNENVQDLTQKTQVQLIDTIINLMQKKETVRSQHQCVTTLH